MKLRNKIHLYTTVLFILLLILINVAVYFSFSRMMYESELEQTVAESEQILTGINQRTNQIPASDLVRAFVPINGKLQIVLDNEHIDVEAMVPNQPSLMDIPIRYYQSEKQEIIEYNGIPHAFVSTPIIWNEGVVANLQVIESLKGTAENLRVLQIVLTVVTVIALIPLFISARLLSEVMIRPITSMIDTMTEIRKSGHYKRLSFPTKSKDELMQMGKTFNDMMDLLETNYEKQEQFVTNASHELKTPLTVIESYASLLKRRGMDQPELFEESVEAIHSEAVRMRELTQQLLLLARHEEHWKVEIQEVSLFELVGNSVRSFQEAFHRKVDLDTQSEELFVRTDPQKLKQILYIFLDNAYKYSQRAIQVRITSNQEGATIEIIDSGFGIPKNDLPKVFDRFYRVDKARTRKTGGFGLGLALAKEIADAIGVRIQLKSLEGNGTTAIIVLPQLDSQ
ncbi:signal transduction histidine kinase [Bacillus pakistanensis]|uniref:histidine kinase n=1 Tax=Rossellomorea pakistanensis TaxID=992288 RepID=A0ABS2NEG2_9BACI|nr:HAMP domain-containing sensor histidine kinase [Bacillus pakistanensis]MBM7586144.1 signal transduction histidine kinase [Bacillus pakistanensis]